MGRPARRVSTSPEISPRADVAAGADVAPGAVIFERVQIGERARIGAGAVIHAGTVVGQDCVIEEQVVLGKHPRLRPGSSAASAEIEPLVLDADVTVCCGAIVYAGTRIATRAIIGDQAQVRERVTIGSRSVVGRGSAVEFGVRIGERVVIQSDVYLAAGSLVEDDVFLAPGVLTTNDDTMGRHPRGQPLRGAVFRRACRVGGGVVLVPGVAIGPEAFVAAGAVVTHDVGAREVVMGVPARVVRRVPDADLIERWR